MEYLQERWKKVYSGLARVGARYFLVMTAENLRYFLDSEVSGFLVFDGVDESVTCYLSLFSRWAEMPGGVKKEVFERRRDADLILKSLTGGVVSDREGRTDAKFKGTDIAGELRKVKDREEITRLVRACRLTARVMRRVLKVIEPGIEEWVIVERIDRAFRRLHMENAFPSLVQSNALDPHKPVQERVFAEGDSVIVDIGGKYRGYCADMSRSVLLQGSSQQERAFETVLEAQRASIEVVLRGVEQGISYGMAARAAEEVVARRYELSQCYLHALGHGVGLEVHEEPLVVRSSKELVLNGHVFTLEPGLYHPDFGGFRTEDTFLARSKRIVALTR